MLWWTCLKSSKLNGKARQCNYTVCRVHQHNTRRDKKQKTKQTRKTIHKNVLKYNVSAAMKLTYIAL